MIRLSVRYVAVAALLGALLAAVLWLGQARVEQIRTAGAIEQEAAAAAARERIERRVLAVADRVRTRAESLASDPDIAAALSDSSLHSEAVRLFQDLDLPTRVTAELYTPTPALVAWNGPSLPLGEATRTIRFLSAPQTATASDGSLRDAIVAWVPIRPGRRVVGAVRVFEVVRTRVPVRNQFLQDYDLTEAWESEVGVPMEVAFGPGEAENVTVVRSEDGVALARIRVPTPSLDGLIALARDATRDVAAFWGVLLLGWGIAGLWVLHVHRSRGAPDGGTFVLLAACLVGARYALLALDVPARWFDEGARLSGESLPLFDPSNLGSGIGGGLLGSAGELVVTAVFAAAVALLGFRFALGRWQQRRGTGREERTGLTRRWALAAIAAVIVGGGAMVGAALLVRRAILDATLPYFDRTAPLPDALVLTVFASILLVVCASVVLLAALAVGIGVRGRRRLTGGAAVVVAMLGVAYVFTPLAALLPWFVALAYFGAATFVAWWTERGPDAWAGPLTLRGGLLVALATTALAYPVAYHAAADKEEARLRDAAEEFADGEDARVAFALEGVLLDARASDAVADALRQRIVRAALRDSLQSVPRDSLPAARRDSVRFDSLATDLVTGSLLAALADYTVGLAVLAPDGDTLGAYREAPALRVRRGDPLAFEALRRRYVRDSAPGFVVEREAAPGRGKFRYAGVGPILRAEDGAVLGWVTAQADPKPDRTIAETPFPRVLVPAGLTSVVESDLAFGEFRDGVLVRTRGAEYGRFRLRDGTLAALERGEEVWMETEARGGTRVYYHRAGPGRVIAVRAPDVIVFDHLYFYLRMLVPALALALVAYGVGLIVRRRAGVLHLRSRLRDRVLNRFLIVGVASVVLTGLIGQQVVVTQNRQAVEDRLKRRLARVEAALYAGVEPDAGADPSLARLLDRARPDLVGPQLGLDVNLYRGADLAASSRSQLVRQQLLDRRLPAAVYEALFVEGERYAFAEEQIGTFTYTTGYEALPDAEGRPGAVLAVPTLPEQAAIEADQARMIAYLFGVLLLLLVGIFLITTLLAGRLTRPFRRLREGLLAVGAGGPGEPIPVESTDEVGELIETFNAMRHQLDESRRKLAQQERELAWREMARQVAHEIKNPLTPMKLSVQHLRRAHQQGGAGQAGGDGEADGRFSALLDRITGTLIEQIDALTRIANEFSSFARLPSRHLVRLDLGDVMREAAALLGEEEHARIALDLTDAPLPVRADREELRRVYINLLKNALQAMPEDERGTITLRTAAVTGPEGAPWARSTVRDTGTGIPEEVREKVFQPNFSTKTSGMGLGLAITKKAIEELGGSIDFETEVGVGTVFHIRLPLATDEAGEPSEPAPRDAERP